MAVVVKGYPRLSETFIAQELHALEARGFELAIFSLREPTDDRAHPLHSEIRAPIRYLPEYLHRDIPRVWRSWRAARNLPGYRAARASWWRDLRRDFGRNRIRRFGQALVLAAEMPAGVAHLHAHFLHTPASVARYAAAMRGLGWSCFAHAKDIWTLPEWEKREKLADCAWTATCTEFGARHLRGLAPTPERVALVYHGLDFARFPAPLRSRPLRDGRDPDRAVTILAVGRAVEKKGLDDLLHALALLPASLHWRLVHVGGGPLLASLRALAGALGIAERVRWAGAQAHDAVLDAYRAADVFALPCRVARDGDRDGLPNVLLEAQSQRLACVSTRVAGIAELIVDGVTGLLVDERSPAALCGALARLIADAPLRAALAEAGYERVVAHFSSAAGADALARRLQASLR